MAKLMDLSPELHTEIAGHVLFACKCEQAFTDFRDICALAKVSRYWTDVAKTAIDELDHFAYKDFLDANREFSKVSRDRTVSKDRHEIVSYKMRTRLEARIAMKQLRSRVYGMIDEI